MRLDYLVIGAGPAGLQLAHLLQTAGRDYLVCEAGPGPGTFFKTFPRHRQLISSNKRYTGWDDPELNLRMDWNSLLSEDPRLLFRNYSKRYFPPADDMVRYLEDFAKATGVNVRYGTRITEIARDAGGFHAKDADGNSYDTRVVVAATGFTQPYVPDIPGIELADNYTTVSTDPDEFTNQRVLVIGKGNSAFETADNLVETTAVIHVAGPHAVRFAWQTHFVGHLRAVNNNLLDTYQLKSQNALLDGEVENIRKDDDGYHVRFRFSRANEVVKELRYDRVIACTGFRFDPSIFAPSCRPALTIKDRFPDQTDQWQSVNVPDLYFAGTLTQMRDFKKSTSGFIHGFRYDVRALHRILEDKYHGQQWPHRGVQADPDALTAAVLERVNRSSALWQLFGFLGDVIVAGEPYEYYEEMPADLARRTLPSTWYLITLEYGPDHDRIDPFDITVRRVGQQDAEGAPDARYLHPVVRHYDGDALVGEHHVTENLENEWTGPVHVEPLRAFFAEQLAVNDDSTEVPA